jgi:hypothetical protein
VRGVFGEAAARAGCSGQGLAILSGEIAPGCSSRPCGTHVMQRLDSRSASASESVLNSSKLASRTFHAQLGQLHGSARSMDLRWRPVRRHPSGCRVIGPNPDLRSRIRPRDTDGWRRRHSAMGHRAHGEVGARNGFSSCENAGGIGGHRAGIRCECTRM